MIAKWMQILADRYAYGDCFSQVAHDEFQQTQKELGCGKDILQQEVKLGSINKSWENCILVKC